MTILLYSYANSLMEKIPALILGLILDGLTIYAGFDFINYLIDYYNI